MKRIVAKAHGDTDTSRDYEYTEWNDIRQFANDFADTLTTSRLLAFRNDGAGKNAA